jgi:hypothetical protein
VTGQEFRAEHGDPARWSDREYEQFEQYATAGDPSLALEVLERLNKATPAPSDHHLTA